MRWLISFSVCLVLVAAAPQPYENDDNLYEPDLRRKLQSVTLKLEDRDDDYDDDRPQLLQQRNDQGAQDQNIRNLQQALQRAQHQAQQQQAQRLDDDDDDVLKEQPSAAVQMMALAKNLDKLQRQYNGQGVLRVQYQPSPIVNTYPAVKAYNLGLAPNDDSQHAVNSQRQPAPVGRSYYRVVEEDDDDDDSYRKK